MLNHPQQLRARLNPWPSHLVLMTFSPRAWIHSTAGMRSASAVTIVLLANLSEDLSCVGDEGGGEFLPVALGPPGLLFPLSWNFQKSMKI